MMEKTELVDLVVMREEEMAVVLVDTSPLERVVEPLVTILRQVVSPIPKVVVV